VFGSSLRQVTVVPTSTVVSDGLNISELRLITGPAGTDVVLVGAAGVEPEYAPQPTRLPAASSSEAAPITILPRRVCVLVISTSAIRHGAIPGWVSISKSPIWC